MSLADADRPITEVIEYFAERGLEVGIIVPTSTGLQKAIMDAHSSLRDYLSEHEVHDFASQAQGPSEKHVIPAWMIDAKSVNYSQASLYRPNTKLGDPRIWIYGLPAYAQPGNVLALLAGHGGLYVINASNRSLLETGKDPTSPLGRVLLELSEQQSEASKDLLLKLRGIATKGFIPSLRPGPTGIGYTLETLLGIRANARSTPDYRGIEIKAGRVSRTGRAQSRTTLFSKVPNWQRSPYSAVRLLQTFGTEDETGRRQIYCSLNNKPNPTFGFYLSVQFLEDTVNVCRGVPRAPPGINDEDLLLWSIPQLREVLLNKHKETFWVKARVQIQNSTEHFHYYEVAHTKRPLAAHLAPLIEAGHIELDLLLHLKKTGSGGLRARDHGYLFKIWETRRSLLFPPPRIYSLA